MATFTATNTTGITLADQALEQQSVLIYGLSGTVTDVQVSLGNLSHTFPADLDMVLVGVDSSHNLEFWSDIGKQSEPNDLTNASFVIADSGATALPGASAVPVSGTTYKPADYDEIETGSEFGTSSTINHPAGNGSATFASAFGGLASNGIWALFIADDAHLDTGTLGSWGVTITTNSNAVAVTGTGGDDTLNVNFTSANSGTYSLNGVSIAFSGVTSFSFDGAGGSDTLNITSNILGPTSYTLSGNTISDSLAAPVSYTNTETVNLNDNGGDATFNYTAPTTAPTSIAAGGGTDTIVLSNAILYDFTAVTITGVEALSFMGAGPLNAHFNSSQVGAGKIASVTGIASGASLLITADSNVDLSGVTFTSWTGADSVTITGSATGEIITGSSQFDEITGGGGADTLSGGGGDDFFSYAAASDIVSGETVDGGAGNNDGITVRSAETYDFTGVGITSVERFVFNAAASVIFTNSQVGPGKIASVYSGNFTADTLIVNATASGGDLSGVSFLAWTNAIDRIFLNGTAAGESLAGSSKNDIITGGGGADTLSGGDGDDAFRYPEATDIASGETVDGGAGTHDAIELLNPRTYDFTGVIITNVEELHFASSFNGAGTRASLLGTQIGTGKITTVTGSNLSLDQLTINATASGVDLSGVNFSSWASDGTDTIGLIGTAAGESLTGSNMNDTIIGGDGGDTLSGGAGNDLFLYFGASETAIGETIDGGAGSDKIGVYNTQTYDFTGVGITNVEALAFFSSFASTVIFKSSQLGAGKIADIVGLSGVDSLIVTADSNVDLSGLNFTNWTNGIDTVTINGTAAGETLSGSSQNDTINGFGGNDTIDGGAGNDVAVFSGARAQYRADFQFNTGNIVITDLRAGAPDGTDTVRNIETFRFSDGDLTSAAVPTIPAITSDGGGATASITIAENAAAVTTVTAADDPGTTFIFSILGSPDTAQFQIDSATGALSFVAAPDYDNPADADHNNSYIVQVGASDGSLAGFQTITVNVTDIPGLTIVGDENDNALTGTIENDTISGLGGNDTIDGGPDNDVIFAGSGHDIVNGGDGNDTLVGNDDIFASEPDTLNGGNGNDTLYVESSDTFSGGPGKDFVYVVNDNPITIDMGATSIEWISSRFGNDTVDASTQTVGVEVYSDGGNDTITGSAFDDIIWSGSGNDTVTGGDGNDVIVGDVGADSISGGNGNDSLYVDASDTLIDGGAGFDAAYITAGASMTIDLAATHIEFVADFVPGGSDDTIDGSGTSSNLEVYAGAGTDTVIGGSGNDFLWGEAGNDTITGNAGNDTLVGGLGADTLTGGPGIDALYGNSGNGGDGAVDTFVFTPNWGTDFVFDFEHGVDKLDMTALGITFADMTFTNTPDGHCYISYGTNLIAVANHTTANVTASDFLF